MPSPLFVVHIENNQLIPKAVSLSNEVKGVVEGIFEEQYQAFTRDVENEIPLERDWKPEQEELLTVEVDDIADANVFLNAADNPLDIELLGRQNPAAIGVKALFMEADDRIMVQRFSVNQVLSRRFLLSLMNNDEYHRIQVPTFALDARLTFIIENGLVKFRNLANVRAILNMGDVYREATNAEVREFAGHDRLNVANVEAFLELVDQPSRKKVSAIIDSGYLDMFTAAYIQAAAALTGLQVTVEGDRVVMPQNRQEVKEVLQFLNDDRYNSPLSGATFLSNSHRPLLP